MGFSDILFIRENIVCKIVLFYIYTYYIYCTHTHIHTYNKIK